MVEGVQLKLTINIWQMNISYRLLEENIRVSFSGGYCQGNSKAFSHHQPNPISFFASQLPSELSIIVSILLMWNVKFQENRVAIPESELYKWTATYLSSKSGLFGIAVQGLQTRCTTCNKERTPLSLGKGSWERYSK